MSFTAAAKDLIQSWRQIASQAGMQLDLTCRPDSLRPVSPPQRDESGWEMVYPAGEPYRVRPGHPLRVELPAPEPRSEEELLRWGGPVTAMVLWSCGAFPLHAAGFQLGDATAAVFAPPGGGKSTLAAIALEQGVMVQGDDLLGLTRDGQILPRTGSLRVEHHLVSADRQPLCTLPDGRGWFPLRPAAPARLGSLLLLRRGSDPSLSRVTGHRRIALFLSAGFLSRYDAGLPPGWQETVLELCAYLPVWELKIPEGVPSVRAAWPRIHTLLEQSLNMDTTR